MPVVPIRSAKRPGPAARPMPQVKPTFLAMAAAQMMADRQARAAGPMTMTPESSATDGPSAAMQSTLPSTN